MKYYITLFLCACFLPVFAFASIRINEVAWMGTATSQYSEWIELYNDGADAVSLAGWKIYKTGTLLYTLSKSINAGGYLLVERTTASAPDAVRGINDESGIFGGGGLRNTGEDLTLDDKNGNAVNILPFADAWPAGDTKSKDTMQWTGTKWITAPGTPDAQNATENATGTTADSSNNEITQTPATETVVVPPPVISMSQPDPDTSTNSTSSPQTTANQTTQSAVTVPVTVSPQIQTPVVHTSTPVVIPTPIVSAQPAAPAAPPASKKPATATKKSTPITPAITQTSDVSADALEDPTDQPSSAGPTAGEKENNHTKIIIFGAVIFIGMALFLLLERFKARQE